MKGYAGVFVTVVLAVIVAGWIQQKFMGRRS